MAADLMAGRICAIRNPADHDQSPILGQGCMLSERIVLTAHQVVQEAKKGKAILVSGPSGVWMAKELWAETHANIALLQLTARRKSDEFLPTPTQFPEISDEPLNQGTQVGYLAAVAEWDHSDLDSRPSTVFLPAWVSRKENRFPFPFLRLSPSFTAVSFIGGPVFLPDGKLCGVLVDFEQQNQSPPADLSQGNLSQFDFLFPRVSPIAPHIRYLEQAIQPQSTWNGHTHKGVLVPG